MTAPLRHTKHEIEHAARMATEYGMTVRLEADGAISFIPANHSPRNAEVDHGLVVPVVSSIDEWRQGRNIESKANGRS